MSHNTSALAPYITEHTTALGTAGAGQSLVIKGFGLGLSTVVDIPSALGVETARTFTKTGATAGGLTITLTVESFTTGTTTPRSIPISMGGVPAQGPDVAAGAISVLHGWTPGLLCTGDKDYWWNPDSLNSTLNDGDAVASFTDSAAGLTMTESDGADQPAFKDSNYVWSGSKTAAAIYSVSDEMRGQEIPLTETGGVITGFTVALIAKSSLVSVSSQPVAVGAGGLDSNKRYFIVVRDDEARTWVAGTYTTTSFASSWDGSIITPILTGSGGSASLTIPELSCTQSISYTEKANSTDPSRFGTLYKSNTETYFGEVIILSREMTASEITLLRAYWADKYGS